MFDLSNLSTDDLMYFAKHANSLKTLIAIEQERRENVNNGYIDNNNILSRSQNELLNEIEIALHELVDDRIFITESKAFTLTREHFLAFSKIRNCLRALKEISTNTDV